ncbi:MAG: hypothetical protein AAF939_05130 [Planctomycetota bacterium]
MSEEPVQEDTEGGLLPRFSMTQFFLFFIVVGIFASFFGGAWRGSLIGRGMVIATLLMPLIFLGFAGTYWLGFLIGTRGKKVAR